MLFEALNRLLIAEILGIAITLSLWMLVKACSYVAGVLTNKVLSVRDFVVKI